MKKVYQTIQGFNGNCWQAVVASLLELELEEVPHFVSHPNCFELADEFMLKHGYVTTKQIPNPRRLKHFGQDLFNEINQYSGVNGFFKACVYSPKLFTPDLMISDNEPTHAVIIDKDFNIVHDPNPEYASIDKYPLEHLLGYNGIISFDCIKRVGV